MLKILVLLSLIVSYILSNEDCKSCHNIESFDKKNHNFSCVECHIKPEKLSNYTHNDIVLNPSSLDNVEIFCAKCHSEDIKKLKKSNHFTLTNEINFTRKLWGISNSDVTLQSLPHPVKNIKNTKDLVDDFLRRKCLKCHIDNQGSGEKGMYRGKGCMSCHISYNQNGTYKGSDITVYGKKIMANKHKLDTKPPNSACLSCHNKEFVGSEYLGLFPKDYDHAYRAPLTKDGKYPDSKYGIDYHHLREDIHYTKGLACVDCHKSIDKNTNKLKTLSCKECHKNISQIPSHSSYHNQLACSSCHASWQMSNYELSVLRDDTKSYDKWKNLTMQEDAYLKNFLNRAIKSKKKPKPLMPDWLSGELKKGIWYSGWRFRRWTPLLLGNDENGKIKILRPFFQYRISFRDEDKNMILDDVRSVDGKKIEAFTPYSPHTISKNAKSCENCHENPLLIKAPQKTDTVLDLFNGEVKKGTALTKQQREKLTSKRYKQERGKMLFNK